MEYRDSDRVNTIALKVTSICCEAYQKKLKRTLLKKRGVCSVEMNPEKNLVVVRGIVDSDSLVNLVAATGKQAEIVCWNKRQPSLCRNNSQQSYTQYSCSYNIQEEEQHKCEDYVPPPSFDEGMCRDYFYKPHTWRPATEFSSFFGHIPHHAGGPFDQHDPRWFMAEPPPPHGYGLGRRHSPVFYDYGYFH